MRPKIKGYIITHRTAWRNGEHQFIAHLNQGFVADAHKIGIRLRVVGAKKSMAQDMLQVPVVSDTIEIYVLWLQSNCGFPELNSK